MKINTKILDEVAIAKSKVLVVTKYFSGKGFFDIFEQLKNKEVVFAFGENRILVIKEKNIDRKYVHFIGNIQSKDISDIVKYCSAIHSLCSLKHAKKINQEIKKQELEKIDVFIQINISLEKQKKGIYKDELNGFLEKMKEFKNINILGISAMGKQIFTKEEKEKEFLNLKKIRDKKIPTGIISAGTSVDYKYALNNSIEIVRVGRSIISS